MNPKADSKKAVLKEAASPRKAAPLRAGVLLDRDGTLNHDRGYLWRWDEFQWIDGAPEALAKLKKAGLKIAAVTNQSGVARGIYQESDVSALHERINQDLFERTGVKIDAWYFCPHLPDAGCECRKPSPRMLRKAASDLDFDLSKSFMVGDKILDYLAGVNAGVRQSLLVRTGYGLEEEPKLPEGAVSADDIASAAEIILSALEGI